MHFCCSPAGGLAWRHEAQLEPSHAGAGRSCAPNNLFQRFRCVFVQWDAQVDA